LAIFLAAVLTVDFILLLGGYSRRCVFTKSAVVQAKACSGWASCILSLVAILALLGRAEEQFVTSAQLWYAAGLVYLVLARVVVAALVGRWHRQGRLLPKVAVLGAGHEAVDLAARLRRTRDAELVGLFLEGDAAKGIGSIAGATDDLVSLAAAGEVDQVVLALPWPSPETLHRTMTRFAAFQTVISIDAALPPLRFARPEWGFLGDIPIMTVQRRPLSGWEAAAKRAEDVSISLLALILLTPLLLFIAILVKLDSPGPVLFRQERYGFNNNRFLVYKFRSMQDDAAADPLALQAQRNDPRVTRVGAFLRQSSLDELPQLLNVLRGDMSLVGPRPHAAVHNEKYALLIDGYLARHRMKPGITGWAQVNGARGGTETPQEMRRRLEYDLFYIGNWSLYLDLKVLLMTIPAVLRGTNAY
jgi:putative colanic acid biosynthesis UDP-glucose lipid carrier transferase